MQFTTTALLSTVLAIAATASPLPHAHHAHKRDSEAFLGITYSPYNNDGTCKGAADVASDLAKLSDYSIIRLYGVDCDQVNTVMAGKSDSQKLFVGIFDVSDISGAVSTIKSAVESNGSWDDIDTVSVGNELVNSGAASPSQIKQYIDTARSALKSAGYSGDIVSVDTHVAVYNNPELCDYSDYIAINAHSFWDGNVLPDGAGKWLLGNIQGISSTCGGKKVRVVETGWPTKGSANGNCVPSKENQKTALSSIASTCGDAAFAFTAFDDLWKDPGSIGVEQYWGII